MSELFDQEKSAPVEKKQRKKGVEFSALKAVTVVQPVAAPTPPMLLSQAIEKGLSLDQMERLIEMQNKWEDRNARKEFFNALSKFQGICPPLIKNKSTSFTHKDGSGKTEYRYHELADIEKHVKPYLQKCGLSYRWGQKDEGQIIQVWLIITHLGGHEEVGNPLSGNPDTTGSKNAIQSKGSTISYLRRYTLTSGLGIASADIDDDAKKVKELPTPNEKQFASTVKKVSEGLKVDEVKKYFKLTDDQEKALLKVQKA